MFISVTLVLIPISSLLIFIFSCLDRVVFAAVDCTLPANTKLCADSDVKGYPTLRYYKFGKFQFVYSGGRDSTGFIKFAQDPTAHEEL